VPTRRPVIQGLGEIALRVKNLNAMRRFYEDVVGLTVWRELQYPPDAKGQSKPEVVFFKIANGYKGHTRILALFDRSPIMGYRGLDPERTTFDHLAFEISLADYEAEKERIERLGVKVRTREFPSFHWRSLFLNDPEGNAVELVCFDKTVNAQSLRAEPTSDSHRSGYG
jgi:catechol 2,3-dioxygenase-like lactoylglutathione lyase family enzyme